MRTFKKIERIVLYATINYMFRLYDSETYLNINEMENKL